MNLKPSHLILEDEPAGVIRIEVRGFFDLPTLKDHFGKLRGIVQQWRAQARPVRALANTVQLMPHSPEGQEYVVASHASIYRSGDKVAVLVSSSLVKMQMRRAFNNQDVMEFFISENAALTWLGAPAASSTST